MEAATAMVTATVTMLGVGVGVGVGGWVGVGVGVGAGGAQATLTSVCADWLGCCCSGAYGGGSGRHSLALNRPFQTPGRSRKY